MQHRLTVVLLLVASVAGLTWASEHTTTTEVIALATANAGEAGAAGSTGRIAFVRDGDIWTMDAQGSSEVRITEGALSYSPSWSPDATRLAFVAQGGGPLQNFDIFVVNADGSGRTRLTTHPASDNGPAWSPDGSKIAFSSARDVPSHIYLMNPDGGNLVRLTTGNEADSEPTWSPDGSRVAFRRDGAIYIIDRDGTGLRQLTFPPPSIIGTAFDSGPDWSPDGSKLAFTRYYGQERIEILTVRVDGTGEKKVTDVFGGGPSWSPDGSRIAFNAGGFEGGSSIYTVSVDGSDLQKLTSGSPDDCCVAWQRSGSLPLVVLVHGYDGNSAAKACGMDALRDWLSQLDNTGQTQFRVECLEYRTREGVEEGAKKLRDEINNWTGGDVAIVTHSMGGLVARYYVERLNGRDRVRSLTMLAPPNLGTPVAIPPCVYSFLWFVKFDQGACDLVPFSPLLIYLNTFPGSHAGVDYLVIAGIVGPPGILPLPNDSVVWVGSAGGLGFPLRLKPVSHVGPGLPQPLIGCVGTGIMDSAGVRQEIAQVLAGSAGAATTSAVSGTVATTPPADESKPSTVFSASEVIAGNETIALDVPLPVGLPTATFVFRSPIEEGVTISHSLIPPGGLSLSSSGSDVSLDEGIGFGAMTEARYTVSDPAPGIWRLRVVGEEVPAGGWPFELQVLTTDNISLESVITPGRTAVGEPVEVTAQLSDSGQPVAGATVSARVVRPDGSSFEIPLDGTEAGVYEGELTDTAICGVYQVVVRATGDGSMGAFDRESRGLAIIGVAGDRDLDPCVADGPRAGDVNCDGNVNAVDGLMLLRSVAGISVDQQQPCQQIGTGDPVFGDADCDGTTGSIDSLFILRHVAALPVSLPPGCPAIGT